ncbi:Protein UBASH3A homolog [Eumeta japonica]|uniref:Protein UBASH3A homolog n=1 Tax=Eumeta variegata TaxID=151549 RepID=A0A4C1TRP8_EUMVA|nr:Protein UBASH3A homolog [Eumeta japonica]
MSRDRYLTLRNALHVVEGDSAPDSEKGSGQTSDKPARRARGNIKRMRCLCVFTSNKRRSARFTRDVSCSPSSSLDLYPDPEGVLQRPHYVGVTGYLPAVYTQRTAESDAWTLHKAMSLSSNNSTDIKSESDSATDGENGTTFVCDEDMAKDKSEECYKEWETYWRNVIDKKRENVFKDKDGAENGNDVNGSSEMEKDCVNQTNGDVKKRWLFALRHGERVDLTYGSWVPFCFDENEKYVRKDLNMPLKLAERAGGKENYALDTPLTRVGWLQAYLVGEGLRLAKIEITHVYSSLALRCVETAQAFLEGLQADPSVKIRVEPGLFEYLHWHSKALAQFMTPLELQKAGYNIDMNYKPYVDLGTDTSETVEEFYGRGEKAMHSAYKDTEAEGGNMIFVGHASTLDTLWQTMQRYNGDADAPPYTINKHLVRVPYCALAAMRDKPFQLVPPPCPPSINTSSARFDWKMLSCICLNTNKVQYDAHSELPANDAMRRFNAPRPFSLAYHLRRCDAFVTNSTAMKHAGEKEESGSFKSATEFVGNSERQSFVRCTVPD